MIATLRGVGLSDFGEMLSEAMRRKAASLGESRFTYRDLQEASGVNFTYAQKAVKYGRIPTPDIIEAWSKATGGVTTCADGTISNSTGSGTCSHHGGEAPK